MIRRRVPFDVEHPKYMWGLAADWRGAQRGYGSAGGVSPRLRESPFGPSAGSKCPVVEDRNVNK